MDPYKIRDIYLEMELKLIASFKRNLIRWQLEVKKTGIMHEPWQIAKLRNLAEFRKANRKIIGYYSNRIENEVDSLINRQYLTSYNNAVSAERGTVFDSLFPDTTGQPINEIPKAETHFFKSDRQRVQLLIDELQGAFKKSNGLISRKMDDVFKQTIDSVGVQLHEGVLDIKKATDKATKEFLEKGLNVITYANGNQVNISSYAEMALRSAFMRTKFLAEGKRRDETGNHLVVSSIHVNCCDACMHWQGMILIDDVFSNGTQAEGNYWLLSKAIEGGFLHPNCRHNIVTYRLGISRLPQPLNMWQEREALRNYKQEQRQRGLERELRKWKRLAEGRFDNKKAIESVKMLKSALTNHIKRNPQLRRDYWRERII